MRFAAIADVHGNYLALEAVLADIRVQEISEIVNLGDMASGPLDARRTMDALMRRARTPVARAVRRGHGRLWVIPSRPGGRGVPPNVPFPVLMVAGGPGARHAVLELASGSWRVTFRHVPYDNNAMADLARR